MTNLHTFLRATVSTGLIAAAALSGVAHADTTREIAKFNAKTNSYCVERMVTGSIIPKRVCATYQGWIDQGATITPSSRTQLASK